jgi:basic amino acid/polyamine antiporter, APA family
VSSPATPRLRRELGLLKAISANDAGNDRGAPFSDYPLTFEHDERTSGHARMAPGSNRAVCDGLVWAELGTAMPGTECPYRYLFEVYGAERLGKVMSVPYERGPVLLGQRLTP